MSVERADLLRVGDPAIVVRASRRAPSPMSATTWSSGSAAAPCDGGAMVTFVICAKIGAPMPRDGEDRTDAAETVQHVLHRCIELAADT
jgi:hypothetical protein